MIPVMSSTERTLARARQNSLNPKTLARSVELAYDKTGHSLVDQGQLNSYSNCLLIPVT